MTLDLLRRLGLRRFERLVLERDIDLYITPLRQGQVVASDSSMAVQQTFVGNEIAEIDSIEAVPQYQARLTQHPMPHVGNQQKI